MKMQILCGKVAPQDLASIPHEVVSTVGVRICDSVGSVPQTDNVRNIFMSIMVVFLITKHSILNEDVLYSLRVAMKVRAGPGCDIERHNIYRR